VWQDLSPYVDKRAAEGARRLGLPTDADKLARLADAGGTTRLVAALVRVSLDKKAADEIAAANAG
jgi:hypothetical protein